MINVVEIHVMNQNNILHKVIADTEDQARQIKDDIASRFRAGNINFKIDQQSFNGVLTLITLHILE